MQLARISLIEKVTFPVRAKCHDTSYWRHIIWETVPQSRASNRKKNSRPDIYFASGGEKRSELDDRRCIGFLAGVSSECKYDNESAW